MKTLKYGTGEYYRFPDDPYATGMLVTYDVAPTGQSIAFVNDEPKPKKVSEPFDVIEIDQNLI